MTNTLKLKMLTTAALLIASSPAFATSWCGNDGQKACPFTAPSTSITTNWCGNPGQETCIPVVDGKCPNANMDPTIDGLCAENVDGPDDAAEQKRQEAENAANQPVAEKPIRPVDTSAPVSSYLGLTGGEFSCVSDAATRDMMSYAPNPVGHAIHDPIKLCNVAKARWGAAIDQIMYLYRHNSYRDDSTWINEHCHAEVAVPRNKWTCNEEDLTWVFR
jgi:hypothetical protein